MAYRSLLVHPDIDDRCDARVRAAARLALEHDVLHMGRPVLIRGVTRSVMSSMSAPLLLSH